MNALDTWMPVVRKSRSNCGASSCGTEALSWWDGDMIDPPSLSLKLSSNDDINICFVVGRVSRSVTGYGCGHVHMNAVCEYQCLDGE